ncbi:uncharacterized protein si:rp71-46j2.7 isoform X2 [Oreochromis niloticus]|uniref:uncharacterized protein si:rp71-46j2.7 isoform X2 n=1 Tax=Oreochromis niloticus TaxID=8128 RepID=UPI000674104C|nr:uncharacterized protein LOC100708159 isoform X2 [Oreochromis niloticus]
MYLWRFSIAITLGLVWYCSDYGHTLIECLCFLFCIYTPLLPAVSGRESGTQTDEEAKDDTVQETAVDNLIDGDTPDLAVSLESPYPHVKRSLQQGLGHLVAWLSDPDNLNQLVVSQLAIVTPKNSVEELYGSDTEKASLASQESKGEGGDSDVSSHGTGISDGTRTKGKRKGNKLKEGWSKFVDKMKSKKAKKKKMKKMEQKRFLKITAYMGDLSSDDNVSSREGSIRSQEEEDSDGEDGDMEDYLTAVQEDMIEFKLSYEMWRVGRWAVSIPNADWEDEKLIFTVHLEEKDSPENLQWDIKKSYMDIVHFSNRWQDSASLPGVLVLEEMDGNDKVKEEARVSVEHFLQELVSDNLIGHTQPVFQFLCPLDKLLNEKKHYGGVWGLLSGLAYFLTPSYEEDENSSIQPGAPDENTMSSLHLESTAQSLENHSASDIPSQTLPSIVISQYDSPLELPEETEINPQPSVDSKSSNENGSQEKNEDSDNPLTSHLKTLLKGFGRYRSHESLASTKNGSDEDVPDSGLQREGPEGSSRLHFSARPNKKEKTCFRSGGLNKAKGKEAQATLQRGDNSQTLKNQVNREQPEATKAIFDLLKEISGNSILINIFDTVLKPFMPILKKKVNSFLRKVNPTQVQMAAYIDNLRSKLWPESPPPTPHPPRTDEEKDETRDRAHNLINAKYSNVLVLKKTDVESVFNLFQDREENKTLVYMLLSFLLREFLPSEFSLNASAAVLQKVTSSTS